MTRARHKIPTGLTVEDRFITYGSLSLSFRQFLLLLGGAATGYGGIWKGWADLPGPPRAAAALIPPLVALIWALARPGGRPLEQWAFVFGRYTTRPRASIWHPRPPQIADWRPAPSAWAGLHPAPRWSATAPSAAARGRDE